MMTKFKKALIPTVILIGSVSVMWVISQNPPQAQRADATTAQKINVEVVHVQQKPYTVTIESYGTVSPRTQSGLVSQAEGQITRISENFREGGFFEKGDLLVKLDDRDYKADIQIADAALILAKQALLEEKARAKQAKDDWSRLGKKGKPNDLVLRIPQLETAKANVLSAEAQVQRAKLALDRTSIKAPFSGRILNAHVDVGQVISSNTLLADIYATDYVEVRLPIKNRDLALLNLPQESKGNTHIPVRFSSDLIGHQEWQGRLVRTEGAIDSTTKQLYVVAQIDAPFHTKNSETANIKIGQYVTAEIQGKTRKDAYIIPNKTIYQGSYVFVEKNGMVERRDIGILWKNSKDSLIVKGLEQGENVVTTQLGQVNSGTRVAVVNAPSANEFAQSGDIKE